VAPLCDFNRWRRDMGWFELGVAHTGVRVIGKDVQERSAEKIAIGSWQPFGLRHPVADARFSKQRPGPVILLLLDIEKCLLVYVIVEFTLEVLLEVILITQHRDLGLNAKA